MTEEEAKKIVKETLTEINNNYHGDYCLFKAVHDLNERVTKLENEIKEIKDLIMASISFYNKIVEIRREIHEQIQ